MCKFLLMLDLFTSICFLLQHLSSQGSLYRQLLLFIHFLIWVRRLFSFYHGERLTVRLLRHHVRVIITSIALPNVIGIFVSLWSFTPARCLTALDYNCVLIRGSLRLGSKRRPISIRRHRRVVTIDASFNLKFNCLDCLIGQLIAFSSRLFEKVFQFKSDGWRCIFLQIERKLDIRLLALHHDLDTEVENVAIFMCCLWWWWCCLGLASISWLWRPRLFLEYRVLDSFLVFDQIVLRCTIIISSKLRYLSKIVGFDQLGRLPAFWLLWPGWAIPYWHLSNRHLLYELIWPHTTVPSISGWIPGPWADPSAPWVGWGVDCTLKAAIFTS